MSKRTGTAAECAASMACTRASRSAAAGVWTQPVKSPLNESFVEVTIPQDAHWYKSLPGLTKQLPSKAKTTGEWSTAYNCRKHWTNSTLAVNAEMIGVFGKGTNGCNSRVSLWVLSTGFSAVSALQWKVRCSRSGELMPQAHTSGAPILSKMRPSEAAAMRTVILYRSPHSLIIALWKPKYGLRWSGKCSCVFSVRLEEDSGPGKSHKLGQIRVWNPTNTNLAKRSLPNIILQIFPIE